MDIRGIMNRARGIVHETFAVPALYIETPGSTPVPTTVRLFGKVMPHGDLAGTGIHFSERDEFDVTVRFARSDVPLPVRNAIVSVKPGEAYKLDRRSPLTPGNDFVDCPAYRMAEEDTVGFPVPDGA